MMDTIQPLIFCVDDEEGLRASLTHSLAKNGFRVTCFSDGLEAWPVIRETPPDLVIIDIIMPGMDGLELCRKIRTISETLPVIFLTSRDEEIDRILGLELGADDYLTKPFSMRELLTRIKVIFRRMEAHGWKGIPAGTSEEGCVLSTGRIRMDTHRYTLHLDEASVSLSVTEFRILETLIRSPGVVKTRDQLLQAAYPEDLYVSDRSADHHIKRIRRKLQAVDPGFSAIETLYGAGYRFCGPGEP